MRAPRNWLTRGSITCLSLSLLVSCSDRQNSDADPGISREVRADGVEVVTYSGFPDQPLNIDTLHVIDPWNEDTGYQFSSIRRVVGGDQSLYVLDSRSREIIHLDLNGNMIRAFGGRGEGPGEFSMPSNLIRSDDELHVSDSVLRRISVYTMDGIFQSDYRWPNSTTSIIGLFHIGPDGSLYSLTRPSPVDLSPKLYLIRSYLEFRATEVPVDTLIHMQAEASVSVELFTESGIRYPIRTTPLFTPYLRWDLSSDRLITVSTLKYQIEFRDMSGRLLRLLKGPGEGFEVTAAIRNKWLTEDLLDSPFGSIFRQVDENPDRESLNNLPFTEKRQAISGLVVDPLNRIWVLSTTEDPGLNRVDLFSSEGDYLGHLGDTGLPATFLNNGSPVYKVFNEDNLELYLVMSIPF